jgi:hypothetical protein
VARSAYENGLRGNPALAGKVAVKFVIGTKGDVTSAAPAVGTTLPDATVVSCVMGVVTSLSFPQPEAGTVTVVYPIIFSPGK